MKSICLLIFCLFLTYHSINAQNYKIIESNFDYIQIEFNFENKYRILDTLIEGNKFQYVEGDEFSFGNPGDPWIPAVSLNVGIPFNSNPQVKIVSVDQQKIRQVFVIPYPDSLGQPFDKINFNDTIYNSNNYFPRLPADISATFIARYARIAGLRVSPYQFNPTARELIFNKRIILRIDYAKVKTPQQTIVKINDQMTADIIRSNVINPREAIEFSGKINNETNSAAYSTTYWYDPQKDYYKIYLNEKGVYRLTYEYLVGLGIPEIQLQEGKLEILDDGSQIPIDIVNVNSDSLFNAGDYVQFVGGPAKQTNAFTYLNIYNLQNIYWFSYQADSSALRYKEKDGFPDNWNSSFQGSPYLVHYEKDSLYERLGHALNEQRDYWYWGKSSGANGILSSLFDFSFKAPAGLTDDSLNVTLRVNMHGMTTSNCINPDHKVKIYLTSQLAGEHTFDGPNSSTFEKTFSRLDIPIFENNNFQVAAFGDINPCRPGETTSDEIRVNWFELEFWRYHRADDNHFSFTSPPNITGKTRFNVFNWKRDNMKIYIPQGGEVIKNPYFTNDPYNSTLFVDSLTERVDYYCVADDYFLTPDSVIKDIPSNLNALTNGSDYIIITHGKLKSVANRLADLRRVNFPDSTIPNPRIFVVDVQDIYDEFSGGLLDPYGIRSFVKYAFENWQKPSPKYLVLVGDMSYDYRNLIKESRPNFIPSIPFHAFLYGQAASDNMFVAVSGNDILPDLAAGRLSCETVEEGNVLVDKLENYPNDNSKEWKQNVLLIASGQDASDEQLFGFNSASFLLDDLYIQPNGATSSKVFRYPRSDRDFPFAGEGPKIRQEFNRGSVLASYYGHGGGYQWDLVFLNDDIYQLQNEGRLPFISSVTCYTAHFDNQDVFGEQFNKVPGKGSISFWGSSGLTWWSIGQGINNFAFSKIFNNRDYICGDFILKSKYQLGSGDSYRDSQIALLTLLGDPVLKLAFPDKPDFQLKSSDITIEPISPRTNENVSVKVKIRNLGVIFPGQSVKIELRAQSSESNFIIDTLILQSFGEMDSVYFQWTPANAGLFTLTARINQIDVIPEMDYSDNEASASFAVYDLNKPNIVNPIDGFSTTKDQLSFLFIDNGYYLDLNLSYFVEIDTSVDFNNPYFKSNAITPNNGLVKWTTPSLKEGKYFWRARIFNDADSSQWSDVRIFTITNQSKEGYYSSEKQLQMFNLSNVQYDDSLKSLILINKELPPKPSNETYLENIIVTTDSRNNLSSITTDGKYIYYASMAYYNNTLPSKIYKIGTGNFGSIKGQDYGTIPNVEVFLWHTMFYYSDGFIYAATGDAYSLLKINPLNGDTSRIIISSGMLDQLGSVKKGSFYLNSDGRYVYNLSYFDSLQNQKYVLRTFDPQNNWVKLTDDIILSGTSYDYFSSFFVAQNNLYAYENGISGYMRRFNLSNGVYEEEWLSYVPYSGLYAWTYDWVNDQVYASVFREGFTPSIFKFAGTYKKDYGSIITPEIGPASKWKQVSYEMESNGSAGSYNAILLGFNKIANTWDILNANLPSLYSLADLNTSIYNKLKLRFDLKDTTFGFSLPLKFKNVNVSYLTLPEIVLTRNNLTFQPDSILQGFPINMALNVMNVGDENADSLQVDFYLDDSDSVLHRTNINVPADTSNKVGYTIQTNQLSPQAFHKIKAIASLQSADEYYVYNNIIDKNFFVLRDSVKPIFTITVDGKEIVNGDIISAKPEILITLKDDSPLPLDTSLFTIIFDNIPLSFSKPDLLYNYIPYPNSEATIQWTPTLKDGKHTLEVLAKDASGNFFDTTSSRTVFYVYNQPNLLYVYNYPNPFKNDTYFTFELRGTVVPDEFLIKIYTVAGRLIKEITIPSSAMNIGFNRIYWDGRDEDGDEISNGIYFYKVISRLNDETKIITEKLAKIR